jgi:hypothetical protein
MIQLIVFERRWKNREVGLTAWWRRLRGKPDSAPARRQALGNPDSLAKFPALGYLSRVKRNRRPEFNA